MAKFVLKEDLPKSTQEEITRIEAITSTSRTTAEANFLTALAPYRTNRVLRYDTEVVTTPQSPRDRTQDILEAEGNTLPTGLTGFKVGATFYKIDDTGMVHYINTGTNTSAIWSKLGSQVVSSSPSLSASTTPSAKS